MKLINRAALLYLGIALSLGSLVVYQSIQAKRRADLTWAWQGKGWELKRKEHWQEAEYAFKMALRYEAPKKKGHLFLKLAELYQRQDKDKQALLYYQTALPYELGREQRADAHLQIGNILARGAGRSAAVSHWREASRLTPVGMPLMAAGYSIHKEAEARLKGAN
jgi:tetratricopeptide (TPR) repeat protein